jgi:serine/threonine-protein kinase
VEDRPLARLGRYDLLEPLGSGGMAEVWRAATRGAAGFNKEVALKLIRPESADDERFLAMFVDEARITARLSHPNVVSTLDFGCIGERYFLALELVDGIELAALLRSLRNSGQRLEQTLAIYIVSEIAAGLHYAHHATDQGGAPLHLVHRDVNPANVLISSHGEVKLSDFGIAKANGRSTRTEAGALKGKLSYMSPEQAWGRALDARSDIYALTLVLQELVTGRRALDGKNEIEVLNRAREGKVMPLGREVAPALARVISRGGAPAPESRYDSAADLRAALLPFLDHAPGRQFAAELAELVAQVKPTTSPPAISTPKVARGGPVTILTESGEEPPPTSYEKTRSSRRPRRAIALALGTTVLLGGGAVVWRFTHQPSALVAPPPPAPTPIAAPIDPPRSAPPPAPPVAVAASPAETREAPAPARTKPRAPAAHRAADPATLRIQVHPWAEVWLDGRALGMTPLRPLDVVPGTHTIKMTNPQLGTRSERIVLRAGERKLIERSLRKEQ